MPSRYLGCSGCGYLETRVDVKARGDLGDVCPSCEWIAAWEPVSKDALVLVGKGRIMTAEEVYHLQHPSGMVARVE